MIGGKNVSSPKITPCLWFDDNAEESVDFYLSVFPNSEIKQVTRYGVDQPGPEGQVMTILFTLHGQEFLALNGGPHFKFNEAISLIVYCETQEEVDELWDKLSTDGRGQCGWVKDKFGVSWQIVPKVLNEMLKDPDRKKTDRMMQVLLKMEKLDIAKLEGAFKGKSK